MQRWQRALAEGHPWALLLRNNADKTGTPDQRYADQGDYAAYMYRITGDVLYAQKSWGVISRTLAVPGSRNETREYFI